MGYEWDVIASAIGTGQETIHRQYHDPIAVVGANLLWLITHCTLYADAVARGSSEVGSTDTCISSNTSRYVGAYVYW
jgi:hypothetical protein